MKIAITALFIAIVSVAIVIVAPAALRRGGDSLASLSEPTLSERYTSAFWANEQRRTSDLWTRALSFCGQRTLRATQPLPNCAIVALVADGGAQERLSQEELAGRGRVRQWLQNGQSGDVSNGLTGRGAKGVPSAFGRAPGSDTASATDR